jgi:hypothetical protein
MVQLWILKHNKMPNLNAVKNHTALSRTLQHMYIRIVHKFKDWRANFRTAFCRKMHYTWCSENTTYHTDVHSGLLYSTGTGRQNADLYSRVQNGILQYITVHEVQNNTAQCPEPEFLNILKCNLAESASAGFQFNYYDIFNDKTLVITGICTTFRSVKIHRKESFLLLNKNCSLYEPCCTLWPLKKQIFAKSRLFSLP